MDQKLVQELKESLEKKRGEIEKELEKFAQRDEKNKGDWDTRFPRFDGGETGSAALEKAADEVEEYSTLLSIEYNLEIRLRDINSALEKIKKGKYGICEKCGKEVPVERLKIYPEAKLCLKCES